MLENLDRLQPRMPLFADRQRRRAFAIERCFHEQPPLIEVEPGHQAACHRWQEVDLLRARAKEAETWQTHA